MSVLLQSTYMHKIKSDKRVQFFGKHGNKDYYEFNSDFGKIMIWAFQDASLNMWIKCCVCNDYCGCVPFLKSLMTPKEFYERYVSVKPFEYTVLSTTEPGSAEKLAKPDELKGAEKIGSVKFLKASNSVYIKGKDLYIKCNTILKTLEHRYHIEPINI